MTNRAMQMAASDTTSAAGASLGCSDEGELQAPAQGCSACRARNAGGESASHVLIASDASRDGGATDSLRCGAQRPHFGAASTSQGLPEADLGLGLASPPTVIACIPRTHAMVMEYRCAAPSNTLLGASPLLYHLSRPSDVLKGVDAKPAIQHAVAAVTVEEQAQAFAIGQLSIVS